MKKMKKALAILVCAASIVSVSGCGSKETAGALQKPEGEVAYPETLTIFCGPSSSLVGDMVDYNDVTSFKLLEEATGTHIQWEIPPASGLQEKFNLMVAGGELTDIIINRWASLGIQSYIDDGVILDLSPYVSEYMPNFWNFSKENPDLARAYIDDGGKVATIPYIRKDQRLNVFFGPVIRTDWLEKLNLKVPETADELYNVLKAFKTQDPNGNGTSDEIPMSLEGSKHTSYLFHMFNTTNGFYVKDGKIKFGILEPEFEEAVSYVAKLFKEGLLDPDYVIQERAAMNSDIANDKTGFIFGYQPTSIMAAKKDDPSFKFEGIPNFKDKRGNRFTLNPEYTNGVVLGKAAAITTDCADPFGAMKWLDFIYGDEGHVIMNFGKEGETFNYDEKGIPVFAEKITSNPDPTEAWSRNFGTFNSYFPAIQDWNSYGQYLGEYGRQAIEAWADGVVTDMNLPSLTFDVEQQEIIKTKFAAIETYVAEQVDKIILGQQGVDKLPQIVEQVKSMGIEDVIKVYQNAYDAYTTKDLGF